MRKIFGIAACLLATAWPPGVCAERRPPTAAVPPSAAPARVLFIGNSLTYFHGLPLMVQALAAQAGRPLAVTMAAQPNYALEDHFRNGEVLATIAVGRFDVVVLQQGPSALMSSRAQLRHWAQRFEGPIRASGARPALYMVWPEAARRQVFDAVRTTYAKAAADVGGDLLPAGEAWRAAWRRDRSLDLYDRDGLHPTALGSYAAALVIHAGLFGQSPVGLPAELTLSDGRHLRFDPAQAAVVQHAAWEAWLAFGKRGR